MNFKEKVLVVTCFAALTFLMAVSPWTAAAQGGSGCIPSGVYMGYVNDFGGMYWSITTIPLDPQGDRMVQHVHFLNAEPTFGGLFPTAKIRDLFSLELVRTGSNTWSYSAIGHGFGEIQPGVACGPLAYLIIESGTMTSSDDCEVITHDGTYALYMPYQDVNPKDGLPDEGEQPVLCIPVNHAQRRLAVTPPSAPVFPEAALPAPGDVWVTDNLQSTQNLVGGTDEDVDSERALAVRWYLDDRDCQSYHVYASVDGGAFQYLCRTVDKTENKIEWKAGRPWRKHKS
ncbi:MAG TPA: hypothetical protein PK878_14765 [bacterium]|nr:hypothetical protein [bacterium]HOL96720.1 hypothetical protein [bacterium]HPP00746.1 hypothetical protein [bacterium]